MFKLASILLYMYIYINRIQNQPKTHGTIQIQEQFKNTKKKIFLKQFLIIHHYIAFSAMSRHSQKKFHHYIAFPAMWRHYIAFSAM